MTYLLSIIAGVLGLFWSAQARVTGTVLGLAFNVPVLALIVAAVAAVAFATILYLLRVLIRDGLRLQPRMVNA